MSIIISLLIFCIIVVSHEFGHFIVARKCNIPVKEFWIGFGPTIFSFEKKGTKFCIKPIPLGGACVFYDDLQDDANEKEDEEKEIVDPSWAFNNAPVLKRMMTILSGPCFNFLLAYILSVVLISFTGYSTSELIGVVDNSPAYNAGLREGDVIVKMDHENIHMYEEITLNTILNRGEPVDITYERDGKRYKASITPEYNSEYGRYMFGVICGAVSEEQNVISTLQYSGYYVNYSVKNVLKSLLNLVRGRVKVQEVSGVVGVTETINDVYTEAKSYGVFAVILNMINIAILLSANLGVMNLLPIPALDGGRLIFLIVEAIRRKPLPPEKEGVIHFIGFALLMSLTVLIMYNDIIKLFK